MELTTNKTLSSQQPWHVRFDSSEQSMELYFTDQLADQDISNYLHLVHDMVEFMPVKTLLINDHKIKKDPLSLDWKIIEASWESLCKKGGKRVVVIHQSTIPSYTKEIYTDALKNYGIPIDLEFVTRKRSKIN